MRTSCTKYAGEKEKAVESKSCKAHRRGRALPLPPSSHPEVLQPLEARAACKQKARGAIGQSRPVEAALEMYPPPPGGREHEAGIAALREQKCGVGPGAAVRPRDLQMSRDGGAHLDVGQGLLQEASRLRVRGAGISGTVAAPKLTRQLGRQTPLVQELCTLTFGPLPPLWAHSPPPPPYLTWNGACTPTWTTFKSLSRTKW